MILNRIGTAIRDQNWFVVLVEVLVVVFGVFIGLQVDDWNKARQDRGLEQEYLGRLIADLEADVALFEGAIAATPEIEQTMDIIWKAAQNPEAPIEDPQRLVVSIRTAGFLFIPPLNDVTYNELVASGSLNIIRKTEIKTRIAGYYKNYQTDRQWDTLLRNTQMRYREAVGGVLPVALEREIQWGLDEDAPNLESITEETAREYLRVYASRQHLVDILPEMAAHQARMGETYVRVRDAAVELIAVLKVEMGESE